MGRLFSFSNVWGALLDTHTQPRVRVTVKFLGKISSHDEYVPRISRRTVRTSRDSFRRRPPQRSFPQLWCLCQAEWTSGGLRDDLEPAYRTTFGRCALFHLFRRRRLVLPSMAMTRTGCAPTYTALRPAKII